MAREAVAGAARDEGERGGRVDEGAGDFVHRAIASDGDDDIAAARDGVAGEFGGVARVLRGDDSRVQTVSGDEGGEQG